ncbi:MAG TPA: CBS domain-containing protein [Candidatus Polarisedimenticolia bacterium]|nr:CBS domain-containing protein [Candidatus Polarisedimenticolia bacterium]
MTTRKNSRKRAGRTVRRSASRRRPVRSAGPRFLARDLMTRSPITVRADMRVGALCDLLQEKNINGAPVVDADGRLVGVVTQEDIIYGSMGSPAPDGSAGPVRSGDEAMDPQSGKGRPSRRVVSVLRGRILQAAPPAPLRSGEKPFWAEHRSPDPMEQPVRSIMTSPAISAEEDTPVTDVCRIMWSLRIHRVPVLRKGKVTGLVSSMDLCRAVLEGKIKI